MFDALNSKWIVWIAGVAIPIAGFILPYLGFRKRYLEEWRNDLNFSFAGWNKTPLMKPTLGGVIHAAAVLLITASKDQYFSGNMFYGESELHEDTPKFRMQGSFRFNIELNMFQSVISHFAWVKVVYGTLYFVDHNTKGFTSFQNRDNRIAKFSFRYDRLAEEVTFSELEYYRERTVNTPPKAYKLHIMDSSYLNDIGLIKRFVFAPNATIIQQIDNAGRP